MSHPHGTYLGGIRSVEDIRQRCRVDDETGCWHWGLAFVQGAPSVSLRHPVTDQRMKMRGRRAVLLIARGKDLPKGHVAFPSDECTSSDCMNPDHCRSGDRHAHGKQITRSGIWKGLPSKVAAGKAAAAARRKLTPEAVADARSSDEPAHVLADKWGVSEYAIWAARRFVTHKPDGVSVFNFRP